MKFKLPNYKEALTTGKDEFDARLIDVKVNKTKKRAELELAKVDEDIANKEDQILNICGSKDINFNELFDAQDKLEMMERRKDQITNLLKQMFPSK